MFNSLFDKIEEVISDPDVSEMKLQEYKDWLAVFLEPCFENDDTKKRAEKLISKIQKIQNDRKPKFIRDILSFFS